METYRIRKGHAIAFSSAMLDQDADFHRNNFSRLGERCDFGYCRRPVSAKFEKSKLSFVRSKSRRAYRLSVYDYLHFPNIRDAKPFLWVTRTGPHLPVLPPGLLNMIWEAMEFSANCYPAEDTHLYQALETNPHFVWNKHARFFRFLLQSPDMFRLVARQYVSPGDEAESLVQEILGNQIDYHQYTFSLLMSLDEFVAFVNEYGADELERYERELRQHSVFDEEVNETIIEGLRAQFRFIQDCIASQSFLVHPDVIVLDDAIVLSEEDKGGADLEDSDLLYLPVDRPLLNFSAIKEKVLEAMKGYRAGVFNATLTLFGMSRRHHQPLAEKAIAFCDTLKPDTHRRNETIQATDNLYQHLVGMRDKVVAETGKEDDQGLMLRTLNDLIDQIEQHSVDFIQKDQPRVHVPVHTYGMASTGT